MNKLNTGTDTRPDGYYRVLYEGTWMIAQYEKTAYGRGFFYLPGVRGEKVESEFMKIDENKIIECP